MDQLDYLLERIDDENDDAFCTYEPLHCFLWKYHNTTAI